MDDQGERTQVDELQIEPGTKTTRLKSGKYEITLDAASDSFGLTNGTFTIRNGQTVVATITPRSKQAEEDRATIEASEPHGDPRLTEVVYDGETLDAWLQRLEFERNPEEITRALTAIKTLANASLRDVLEQPLIDFLLIPQSPNSTSYSLGVQALLRCYGSDGYRAVARLLSQIGDDSAKLDALQTAIAYMSPPTTQNIKTNSDFLRETQSMLASATPGVALQTAEILRAVADQVTGDSASELQTRIVNVLVEAETLTNENFWLARPTQYGFEYSQNRGVRVLASCPAMRKEVASRSLAVITDRECTDKLYTQAVIVLRTWLESGGELTASQREMLTQRLASVLADAAANSNMAMIEVELPRDLKQLVPPLTPLGTYQLRSSRDFKGNRLIVTLNLVEVANLQDGLVVELEDLFETFQQLPLHGNFLIDHLREPETASWDHIYHESQQLDDKAYLANHCIYLQAGFLLGESENELFARFDQKFPSDIAREVEYYLDQLEFGKRRQAPFGGRAQSSAIVALSTLMPEKYPPRAARVVEEYLTANLKDFTGDTAKACVRVWAATTGDDFLESYTRALRKADDPNLLALSNVSFANIENFRCTDPSRLQHLLEWCDEALAPPNAVLDQRTQLVLGMLTNLAVEESNFGLECQQLVVEHLEASKLLDDQNFWLFRPFATRYAGQWGRRQSMPGLPMRLAKLRRAISAIQPESGAAGPLVCQALAILCDGAGDLEQLPAEVRQSLVVELRRRLEAASSDPEAHTQLHFVSLEFYPLVYPQFGRTGFTSDSPTVTTSSAQWTTETANEVIIIQNLLLALVAEARSEMVTELRPQVEALHAAMSKRNIADRCLVIERSAIWEGQVDRWGSPQELIFHTWFVQSGALLGQDVDMLNRRPLELDTAERERRLRLVHVGDTLAVHIPNVLPRSGDPPVIQAGSSAPVVGFPVPVSSDGKIQLPLIEPLEVKDLDLSQVKAAIAQAYNTILRDDGKSSISVQFLLRAGQSEELRNIAGNSIVAEPSK